jgi:non-homologous end joining protein Ku
MATRSAHQEESGPDPLLQERHCATTLRYKDEVMDPSHFAELKDLPEAGEEELAMMTKIVDKMTKTWTSGCTMTATRKGLKL